MPKKCVDLTGKKFGKLVVLFQTEKKAKDGCVIWRCECECGQFCDSISTTLINERKMSCGCGVLEAVKKNKHGMINSTEYRTWQAMIQRCTNSNNVSYHKYGMIDGRDICTQWLNSFEEFYKDMGPKPSKKHSIGRIDNLKGYCPENCKWATPEEQSQNQTTTKLNPKKVRYIRRNIGVSNKILAEKFFVSEETIRQVKKYETWKNIK